MHTITETTEHDLTDLLARAGRGDQVAWSALTRRYAPLLWSRVRRYRLQEADGVDVVQTTWMRLAEHLDRIHTPEHLAGWLATVVSHECQRTLRLTARALPVDDAAAAVVESSAGPEERAVTSEMVAALRTAVAGLPTHRRELIEALFDDGRPAYAQVARDLGVPIGSLGPTRARTLAELARVLRRQGF
ncbi:MAG: sigma-70 family RNA polymerase sigma factor [Pseudonocardia sp.]|jgi:RNA polymerase sigma factor (sigma-70 family)|uniref:RNA polymerase sigma factor n=1 Tax=Pseudonocardia sp. TaxID=60912 RepID=UPI001AC16CE0|nr:sigma-70 family RNA polymerase sigma factor [Pseudonocardia sp.]MBN9101405.1 sigma-70 family RNA polymerase sigma factor [Pseudonocardia sp.]